MCEGCSRRRSCEDFMKKRRTMVMEKAVFIAMVGRETSGGLKDTHDTQTLSA
jgi:hypothetical protein